MDFASDHVIRARESTTKPLLSKYQFADNPKVKSDGLNACYSIMTGKKDFNQHFEDWLRSVQGSPDETSVFPCQDDNDNVESQVVTCLVVGSSSRKSKSSKTSSPASDRLRKA